MEWLFKLNEDEEVYSIVGIDGDVRGDIVIPSTYEGKPVSSIASFLFSDCDDLTSAIIPDSITSIGVGVFRNCRNLTSVTLGKGIGAIGCGAFCGCTKLSNVVIPDNVTFIEGEAFKDCGSLTSIAIPNSVTKIGIGAFESCYNLTSVTIGEGVISIGDEAFFDCVRLTRITIPHGLISIGGGAFQSEENRKYLMNIGHVVYLYVSPEVIWERIKGLSGRPLLKCDNPYEKLVELYNARHSFYEMADYKIDTNNLTKYQVIDELLKVINAKNS